MRFTDLDELGLQLSDRLVLHHNPPSWNWRTIIPQYYNLWICLSGKGTFRINGRSFSFSPGWAILLHSGDQVYADKHDASHIKNIALHFTTTSTTNHPLLKRFHNVPAHLRPLNLLHEMTRYIAALPVSSIAEANRWTEQILLIFARDWELGPEDPIDRILRDQIERIKELPYGSISVPKLAAEASLSLSHYRRRFAKLTNTRPNAFFLQQRLQSAQTLLIESILNIDQIAQALGYRDTPFFSRQFKSKTGVPPSQFRAQARLKK